jgi:hypothetical protein
MIGPKKLWYCQGYQVVVVEREPSDVEMLVQIRRHTHCQVAKRSFRSARLKGRVLLVDKAEGGEGAGGRKDR